MKGITGNGEKRDKVSQGTGKSAKNSGPAIQEMTI